MNVEDYLEIYRVRTVIHMRDIKDFEAEEKRCLEKQTRMTHQGT
jgi:hypothetical protein